MRTVIAEMAQPVADQVTYLRSLTQPQANKGSPQAGFLLDVSTSECLLVHLLVMITRNKSTRVTPVS